MSKNLILAAAAAWGLFIGPLNAVGAEVGLTVDSLLARVDACNTEVRAARLRHEAAREGVEAAKTARLPQLDASLELTYIGDGTIIDRDFAHAMRDRLPHFGNTLNVSLYQPVYQGGAVTASIDVARRRADMAAVGTTQQLEASSIEAISAWMELVKMANRRRVMADNIELTRQLLERMDERFRQGTALKNDITRYRLRLSTLEYDLTVIDNAMSIANRRLVTLLALDPSDTVVPLGLDSEAEPPANDENHWQRLARLHSTELQGVDSHRALLNAELSLEKAARRPSVGIIAGDNLSGPVTFEIPAINKNYNAWYAGVAFKMPLSGLWTAPRRIGAKRLEIQAADEARLAVDEALDRSIHQAWTLLEQAREMLRTERLNVQLANENFAVVETRFQNGMAMLTDMLDASSAKLDSEMGLVNAAADMWMAYYRLRYTAGTLQSNANLQKR